MKKHGHRIILFGGYGTGKTTLALTLPGRTLHIDMQEEDDYSRDKKNIPGYQREPVQGDPRAQLNKLMEVHRKLVAMSNDEARFDNVVVDSSSAVRRQAELQATGGPPTSLDAMKGLSMPQQAKVKAILDNVLVPFFDLAQLPNPYNVVITGQEVTMTAPGDDMSVMVVGYAHDLPPRIRGVLARRATAVWRLALEPVLGRDGLPGSLPDRHLVYVRESTFYGTKSRTDTKLPQSYGATEVVTLPMLLERVFGEQPVTVPAAQLQQPEGA